MLPRSRRIPRDIFERTAPKGKTLHGRLFSLRISRLPEPGVSRFSFVVSRKVAGSAVKRNKMRRTGYRAVEKLLERVRPGFSCIFFMKHEANTASEKGYTAEAEALLEAAGVLKASF